MSLPGTQDRVSRLLEKTRQYSKQCVMQSMTEKLNLLTGVKLTQTTVLGPGSEGSEVWQDAGGQDA